MPTANLSSFKIATWNINSINVRIEHLLNVLKDYDLDVLAIQETKSPDNQFPIDALANAGYHTVFSGQKSYNGTCIISKQPAKNASTVLFGMETDPQRRFICAEFDDGKGNAKDNNILVIDCYVPNGSEVGDPKYDYKLRWLAALNQHIEKVSKTHKHIVLLGDFNIAPEDKDVYDPAEWQDKILCSPAERQALADIQAHGLTDLFRQFNDNGEEYSWWDYRAGGFQRNNGMRIDLILTSAAMSEKATACTIEKAPRGWERPSDHTPVIATFNLSE